MKVFHFAPELAIGGPDELAMELAYALQIFDVTSVVAAPNRDLITPVIGKLLRFVRYKGGSLPGLWGEVFHLRRLLISQNPDILHAYGYRAVSVATRACACLPSDRRPSLVASLGAYPKEADFLERTKLMSCDAITMIRTELRSYLKSVHPPLIKSWIIPYGANDMLFHPNYRPSPEWNQRWRVEHPQLDDRFLICLPSPIGSAWCTQHIVPLLSSLRSQDIPAHALLAGSIKKADPSFLKTLHRDIRSAGLDECVSWLDAPEDLRDILCVSHAVLCLTEKPVVYDRTALQALALGRPTAGYGHGAVLEYLEAMQPMGVLPVGDVDSATDLLSQWYNAPPDPPEEVPYPYKLSDTAKKYYELYTNITQAP